MNDAEFEGAWTTLQPTARGRQQIDARVFEWLEAHETPLVAEWLGLFKGAPFTAMALVGASALSIVIVSPLIWLVRALM